MKILVQVSDGLSLFLQSLVLMVRRPRLLLLAVSAAVFGYLFYFAVLKVLCSVGYQHFVHAYDLGHLHAAWYMIPGMILAKRVMLTLLLGLSFTLVPAPFFCALVHLVLNPALSLFSTLKKGLCSTVRYLPFLGAWVVLGTISVGLRAGKLCLYAPSKWVFWLGNAVVGALLLAALVLVVAGESGVKNVFRKACVMLQENVVLYLSAAALSFLCLRILIAQPLMHYVLLPLKKLNMCIEHVMQVYALFAQLSLMFPTGVFILVIVLRYKKVSMPTGWFDWIK